MTVLVVIAMRAEAEPVVGALGAEPVEASSLLPVRWFAGDRSTGPRIVIAVNGVDPDHRVDSIGTDAAALTTLESIRRFDPTWVVSAGTAGGFASRGGFIGQVVVAEGPIIHHDRRIPLGGFQRYGRGEFPTADLSAVAERLGFTAGPCSTGNSLDAPPSDLAAMAEHGTLAKDMEAATVAGVARLAGLPFTACRVITDLVDGPEPTADQFHANFAIATRTLAGAIPRLIASLPTAPPPK